MRGARCYTHVSRLFGEAVQFPPRARSIDCPRGYEVALTHSPGENRPKRAFILGENRVYSPIRDHNSRSPSIPLCWSLLREIVIYIALGSSAGGEKMWIIMYNVHLRNSGNNHRA